MREYRARHDLRQHDLADMLGWSQSVVARMESSAVLPQISTIRHLAKVLGVQFTITLYADSRPLKIEYDW